MSYSYHLVKEDETSAIELMPIKSDLNKTVWGDLHSNQRSVDIIDLLKDSASELSKLKRISQGGVKLFFIYRSVATGGITRRLTSYHAKPLTMKAKSMDPSSLIDDGLKLLSGCLPTNAILGKPVHGKKEYKKTWDKNSLVYRKTDETGNLKTFLFFNKTTGTLKWEQKNYSDSDYELAKFCADEQNRPFIADWDMVNIGLSVEDLSSIKNKDNLSKLRVVYRDGRGNLPEWLFKALQFRQDISCTQHGPESLYCGNPMQEESFALYTTSGTEQDVVRTELKSWEAYCEWIKDHSHQYFLYQFDSFNGEEQDVNFKQEIEALNNKLS